MYGGSLQNVKGVERRARAGELEQCRFRKSGGGTFCGDHGNVGLVDGLPPHFGRGGHIEET